MEGTEVDFIAAGIGLQSQYGHVPTCGRTDRKSSVPSLARHRPE